MGNSHISISTLKVVIFWNCQGAELVKLMQAMAEKVSATFVKVTDEAIAGLHSGKSETATLN